MTFVEKLKDDWQVFEAKPFPPMPQGRTVAGHNVTVLQSEIGAAIISCFHMKGKLGTRQRISLEKSLSALMEVIKSLDESPAKKHFLELHSIGEQVIKQSETID